MNTIEEIARVLKSLKSAVIFTHMRPDGDTLGSALGLSRALSMLGIRNEVVNEAPIPVRYYFLDGARDIKLSPSFDAEAYILVDVSAENRLGELQETFRRGARKKITVNLDHHTSNLRFCRYNYVAECSANCQNIYHLIKALGVTPDKIVAEALLTGLVTDSGAFSHGDVSEETFLVAAACVKAGADIGKISYEAYKKKTKARADLYAATVSAIRYFLGGKLAIAVIRQDMLKQYGVGQDATEGIVDFALEIDSVAVSVCIMEVKKGQYKVSLRSKETNVNEIARVFGGGGHVLASGCMLFGEEEEVLDRLSFTVSQYLGS